MRKILFRGKRIDNGEWVTGHLIRYDTGRARILSSGQDIFCYEQDRSIIQTVAFEVDPSTVGQYTGLDDKNGVKIFEGDIVKIDNSKDALWVALVEFQWQCLSSKFEYYRHRLENSPQKYEVIGNYTDNPELLKG